MNKSKTRKLDVSIVLFSSALGTLQNGKRFEFFMDKKEILSATIDKNIYDANGGFSFDLRGGYDENWKDVISVGDVSYIVVDGRVKMLGMVSSVGKSSTVTKDGIVRRTAVKVQDLGWLFTKFAKFLTDIAYRLNESKIGLKFFNAYKDIQKEYKRTNYNLKELYRLTWDKIVRAYMETIEDNNGQPFGFSSVGSLRKFSDNLFECVSNAFNLDYPIMLNIQQENYENIWDLWSDLANNPFNELYCDTCYKGQKVAVFNSEGTYKEVGAGQTEIDSQEGFRVICRPSPWLSATVGGKARFYDMLEEANVIDPIKIIDMKFSKSSAEVKSLFLVYPKGGLLSPDAFKANGDFDVDQRFLGTWGLDMMEVPLASFDRTQKFRSFLKDKATILKNAYANIDKFWAGECILSYQDVRVGQCVITPEDIDKLERQMGALVTQVTDTFTAPASFITKYTFVRGEVLDPEQSNIGR